MSTENKHERKMAVQDEAISKVQRILRNIYSMRGTWQCKKPFP